MSRQTILESDQFNLVSHPLVQHKLSLLRDTDTDKKQFRELVHEITVLLLYEATKKLPLRYIPLSTPLETFDAPVLDIDTPVVIPILRAGIGMVDAFLSLLPTANVGHIGLYRDEITHEPHRYFLKLPPITPNQPFFVCDPMLATAGTCIAAITELKKEGVKNIHFICLVASPEGAEKLINAHPDVSIYSAALDRKLDTNAYILPGLGDAGDRLFGTL